MIRKNIFWIASLVLVSLFNISCTDEDTKDIGVSIQPQGDVIVVQSDTFLVSTENFEVPYISAQNDTMLLGDVYSSTYGSTKADLLLEFASPEGYTFPADSFSPEPDSLVMLLAYTTWFGSTVEPIQFDFFEMKPNKVEYTKMYYSNLDPDDFVDFDHKLGTKTMTSVDYSVTDSVRSLSTYLPVIRYKFSEEDCKRFFNFPSSVYDDVSNLTQEFPGLYVTSTFGNSIMLHIQGAEMRLYYHYTYNKFGKDTVVEATVTYPANHEVRQLTHITHQDMAAEVNSSDSINTLSSPSGMGIKIKLPIGEMKQKIGDKLGDKLMTINMAQLTLEIPDLEDESNYVLTTPYYLLAIDEDDYNTFVNYNTVPNSSDSTMVISAYNSTDSTYIFDYSYYLTKALRSNTDPQEVRTMIVVPVDVSVNSTYGTISTIRPRIKLSGIRLRSSGNTYSPVQIKLLYSGF